MYTAIKDIPKQKISRFGATTRRKYPFDTMDVGDMFFIEGPAKPGMHSYVSTVGKALGKKFTTRTVHMRTRKGELEICDKDALGATLGVGVWRSK